MSRPLTALAIGAVFLVFMTPMEIGSVWWHLSTGRWIIEHGALPADDPFGQAVAARPGDLLFLLQGFWLCQILLASVEKLAGLYGIIALKASLFALTFALVLGTVRRYSLDLLPALLVAAPAVYLATFYDESRPQTFTFLFFAASVFLLEKGRAACIENAPLPKALYAMPAMMLVWSNMHPGFVIGGAVAGAYLVEALIAALRGRNRQPSVRFTAVCAAAILVSALNPNGLEAVTRTVEIVLASMRQAHHIHEHMPAREFAAFTGQPGLFRILVVLIAMGALSFAARIRRPDILHLLVFAGLAYLSIKTFRSGLFFAIFTVVVTGANLSNIKHLSSGSFTRWRPGGAVVAVALLIVSLAFLAPRTIIKRPMLGENIFPDKATSFIEESALPPNLYHPYEWGGYLMWRLHPKYKVFIDARAIGPLEEHRAVLRANEHWSDILDRYEVNTVLYWPLMPYRSDVPPIVLALMNDPGWGPVYWDTRAIIFVRVGLAQRGISKSAVWELLTSLLAVKVRENPDDPAVHASLGELYAAMGRKRAARDSFLKAIDINPSYGRALRGLQSVQ